MSCWLTAKVSDELGNIYPVLTLIHRPPLPRHYHDEAQGYQGLFTLAP